MISRAMLRRGALLGVLAAGVAGCGGGGGSAPEAMRAPGYRGALLSTPLAKPAFELRDTRGAAYDFRRETQGKVTLLFFGYTSCPDVCPVQLANLAAVFGELGPSVRDAIRVVFVTTDPERDTPERLRGWLDHFDESFVGLIGDTARTDALQRELGLPVPVRTPTGDGGYSIGHAAQVLVFTRDGRAHLVYPFGTRQADWAHDLPKLVEEGWAAGSAPEVSGAVASISAAPDRAALYFRLSSAGAAAELTGLRCTAGCGRAMLHRTVTADGRTRMDAVPVLRVGPDSTVQLAPGGYHVMLMGLPHPLAVGDTVGVVLEFRDGRELSVRAPVADYPALLRITGAEG